MERFFLEFVLRTGLITLAAGIALRVFRIRVAAAEHAVWAGVLGAMLVLPVWMEWGPKAPLRVLPSPVQSPVSAVPASTAPVSFAEPETSISAQGPAAPVTKRWAWTWRDVGVGIYLLGAGTLLLRLAVGTIRASRLTGASCVAPVTVGVIRPRVILPESGSEWPEPQLDAVLTHERAHARRRDPLFQWLALFNRAVFWFHPLAWWLEQRLSALAEEACDAAVLERGHDPQDYCAYLIELAHAVRSAGTRVNMVAMAMPGSYLPARVKKMMDGVRAPRVSAVRMTLAALACAIPAAVFAAGTLDHVRQVLPLPTLPMWPLPQAPVLLAQAPATPPAAAPPSTPAPKLEFEVASVKALPAVDVNTNGGFRVTGGPGTQDPEHIRYTQASIFQILTRTLRIQGDQLVGPDWVTQPFGAERYEILANIPPGTTQEQAGAMMLNLLKERFHLEYHREKRNLDVYELVVAKGGSKLRDAEIPTELPMPEPGKPAQAYKGDDGYPNPPAGWPSGIGLVEGSSMQLFFALKNNAFRVAPANPVFATAAGSKAMIWRIAMRMVTIQQMMDSLQSLQGITHLVDRTGLTGQYDVKLRFTSGGASGDGDAGEPAPDIFEALEKQLGLKLQKVKAPIDVIVIDRIDRTPVEN